jgi:hypothetical protein
MSRRTSAGDSAVAAAVFTLAFLYFYLFHQLGWFMEDEGVLYYHYLRVYRGDVPYRDFFTGYGPIGYYVHALAFRLFGVSINAIRILTGAVNAATAAGLYVVARRATSRGFALIPPAFFVAMQPWDIAVMVFQNSPYPSWYALLFAVWGTWAMLRFLEADGPRSQAAWLIVAGFLGGATFFTKQNTGTFFLWGISGFLASCPSPPAAPGEAEAPMWRGVRGAYLALLPLATLLLVRNFLDAATLGAFVLPVAVLAVVGMRQRFGATAWRHLLMHLLYVSIGVLLAIGPWLLYFGRQMGVLRFLNAILFLGAEVDRNLYVPFPEPGVTSLALLALLAVWGFSVWRSQSPGRSAVGRAALLTVAVIAAVVLWEAPVLRRVALFQYNLWQIYAAVSKAFDNAAAYLTLVFMAAALVVAWRPQRQRSAEAAIDPEAFLCIVWIAVCSFIAYYPRMDYAHLVGAMPLVYVAAVALLPRLRRQVAAATAVRRRRAVRLAFNLACVSAVSFIVATKSAPKVYSLVGMVKTDGGMRLGSTPKEWLHTKRANLYFPIYLERQRLRIVAIRELIQYVRDATSKGESVFAFPALPMLYFLTGPANPTRHDYFLGDNVSFRDQLDVLRTLERDHVDLVIVPNDPSDYFVAKSKDFTRVIWEYLNDRYYLERRIGPYDVLRRYPAAASQESRVR